MVQIKTNGNNEGAEEALRKLTEALEIHEKTIKYKPTDTPPPTAPSEAKASKIKVIIKNDEDLFITEDELVDLYNELVNDYFNGTKVGAEHLGDMLKSEGIQINEDGYAEYRD